MKTKIILKILPAILFLMCCSNSVVYGFTNLNDCLITSDIGKYVYDSEYSRLGNASGVVNGADHFDLDHSDAYCEGEYSNLGELQGLTRKEKRKKILSVDVEVTQHTGGDSDRWLLHELDAEFRTYYGMPGKSYGPEKIEGQTILVDSAGGNDYRWLSGNKIIKIEYIDLQMTKSEPLEVIKAYLVKHPSTIATFTLQELRNSANVTKWIKDEMERRLWLCDKWNAQYQAGGVKQADLIYNLVRSMKVFLNYREKYFSVAAQADLDWLSSYKQNNDIASIQTELTEYKTWWKANKGKSITLP